MDVSTLALEWRTRAGGGGCTERRYLDFVVDGVSMHDRLMQTDHATPLGCWGADAELHSIGQLLARADDGSRSGRAFRSTSARSAATWNAAR